MAEQDNKQSSYSLVYVIDRDFRLVYMSDETRRVFPKAKLNERCFTALRGETSACEDCPWAFRTFESDTATRKAIFNAGLQKWLELSCISLEWPQAGLCTVVCAKSIDETNKDALAQFTHQTVYDELLEVDLEARTFEFLYVEEGKYQLPTFTNSLDDIKSISKHLIHPEDREAFLDFWSIERLQDLFGGERVEDRGEFRQKLSTGSYHWTSQTIVLIQSDSDQLSSRFMCFILDIEEQKRRTDVQFRKQALLDEKKRERDELTGLYRSEVFFRQAASFMEEKPERAYQVACLDIKNFRLFNEWYGREAGDRVLRIIAQRLKSLEHDEHSVAARFDADNFVVCMPQETMREHQMAETIRLTELGIDENVGFVPVMGVCEISDAIDLRTAVDRATLAKSLAKQHYVQGVVWYEEDAARAVEDEVRTLLDVQSALKNREIVLYWQPQCDIRSGRAVGVEALARWQHPQEGLIAPASFIPLLEKTGFIVNLDLYVWEEACRCLRAWLDAGIKPVPISVNVSQTDFLSLDVPGAIADLMKKYAIDRRLLKIEITESAFSGDVHIVQTATRLKDMGFTVMMDDFGSGSSSLGILKQIDVDVLKIDMQLLDWSKGKAGRGASILESVLRMARMLELCVVAEGVEESHQVAFLESIGCHYAQGYYFHRPMATENFTELLGSADEVDLGGIVCNPLA